MRPGTGAAGGVGTGGGAGGSVGAGVLVVGGAGGVVAAEAHAGTEAQAHSTSAIKVKRSVLMRGILSAGQTGSSRRRALPAAQAGAGTREVMPARVKATPSVASTASEAASSTGICQLQFSRLPNAMELFTQCAAMHGYSEPVAL